DLLHADLPARNPLLVRHPGDDLLDDRIGDRGALALLVAEVAGARLLAEAPELTDAIGHRRRDAAPFPDAPADVEAGEVAHGERAHREPEIRQHLVDLVRRRAFQNQLLGLQAALVQHAVADEAIADAHQ